MLKDGENVYEAMQRQWGISSPGQHHLFSVSKYKTDDSYKKELDAKIAELNKQVEKSRQEEARRQEEAIETDIQKLDKNAYIIKYADKLGWFKAAEKWDKGQNADNGINPNYKEELKQVIEKAKNNPTEHQKLVIGTVSKDLEEKAKENGLDIVGYQHDLDVSGTRHAIKEHGQPKTEEPRGQIAITDGDFEKIPEVIYGYDDVSFTGKNKIGRETITYKKSFNDGTIMYVEEIRDKRKTLTINTMYKYKNTGNPRTFVDNNNPLSNASIYIITDIQEDFNPDVKNNVQNNKEQDMALIDELKKLITKVENEKPEGENMDDNKEKVENEKVDKINVCTIGGGCLGVAVNSAKTRTLSLDSKCFKEKGTEVFNKSVEAGWLARTDKDVLTSVLTHELGHTITASTENKAFWDKIKEIKSEYVKNVDENDIKNKDFISKYARKNKDEFVAECFAQATLLKTPSKYAKMVLDEINTHFKQSKKEYKQMKLFNAIMEVLNMDNNIENKNPNSDDEIIWVEGDGVGYCLTEEDYETRKKEVDEYIESKTK